jgi:tetratricopeptide (TPR) repeat protein
MGTLSDIEVDWPRISALLDEVMSRPALERDPFIESLTAPDDRFRDTLRELLALQAKAETEDFMEALPVFPGLLTEPWVKEDGAGAASAGALAPGAEVGPYRLLRQIGEGGMGAVWLAERADGTLKRKVALKLPRLAWASDLAARMARERDILSALEHPNIARLYDAGVDAVGRPWLAIEYVEGSDLSTFCDTARLDLRARVRLFLQVLSAVQYAHGSLVIHRDLKPANILVTPQGEARLLDFGIARLEEGAADAGPALTREGANAMTPRYASPEQVQGKRLTIASDIYSLGVVLHELLTGETPYALRRGTRAEYEQAIVESDLRVPSRTTVSAEAAAARSSTPQTLTRMLRGDLDAVLMRALASAPEGRYASAVALREDLERWLEGRPVSAVPPSRTYALRKFVARNRIAVAASAAAAFALVAVSVVAVLQAQRAERSAAEARVEAARANATKEFLISTYSGADPTQRGGRDATAKELLSEAERLLDTRFATETRLKADILGAIEVIWLNLGDPARAQAVAEKRTPLLLEAGDHIEAARSILTEAERAITRRAFAEVEMKLARVDALVEPAKRQPGIRGRALYLRASLHSERGERDAALKTAGMAVEESRKAGEVRTLFNALLLRSYIRRATGDPATVFDDLDEARALLSRVSLAPVEKVNDRFQLVVARYILGDYRGGWPEMQRIMTEVDALYGPDNPFKASARRYWIRYCLRLGRAEDAALWLGRGTQAGPAESLRGFEDDPRWRLLVARVAMALKDWQWMDKEIAAARRLLDARVRDALEVSKLEAAARILEAEGELRAGRPERAVAIAGEDMPGGSVDTDFDRLWILGNADQSRGEPKSAIVRLREAERRASDHLGHMHPLVAMIRLDLAAALAQSGPGDDRALEPLVAGALPVLRAAFPADHPVIRRLDRLAIGPGLRERLASVEGSVGLM